MNIEALIEQALRESISEKEVMLEAKINELIIQLLSHIIEELKPKDMATLVDKSVQNFLEIQEDFVKDSEIFVKMVEFSGESIKNAFGVGSEEEEVEGDFFEAGTIQ